MYSGTCLAILDSTSRTSIYTTPTTITSTRYTKFAVTPRKTRRQEKEKTTKEITSRRENRISSRNSRKWQLRVQDITLKTNTFVFIFCCFAIDKKKKDRNSIFFFKLRTSEIEVWPQQLCLKVTQPIKSSSHSTRFHSYRKNSNQRPVPRVARAFFNIKRLVSNNDLCLYYLKFNTEIACMIVARCLTLFICPSLRIYIFLSAF